MPAFAAPVVAAPAPEVIQSAQTPQAQGAITLPEGVITMGLSGYIESCYERAKTAKSSSVTERLLRCERQRRGEYDPEKLADIRKTGGAEIYLMLTDIKCTAAESWIKDVMLTAGERPWDMSPTSEPSLPPQMQQMITESIVQEAQALQQAGVPVSEAVVMERAQQMYDEIQMRVDEAAKVAAERMSGRMEDVLQEADWRKTFSALIYDFVTFPACFLKGPILQRRKEMEWGGDWQPRVVEKIALNFERVSVYDMFPSPMAENEQKGYICERIKLSLGSLEAMKGVPGYNNTAIDAVIEQYRKGGLREFQFGDIQQDTLKGRNTWYDTHEVIEGVEFWGDCPGHLLVEWGMRVDEKKVYAIQGIKVGSHTIKAMLNPHALGLRPYSRMCFEDIPGAFWGLALPEKMRDVAAMCNAAGRALANNMALASGPQAEINVDRVADGERITSVHPFKIWQTTSDRTGGGQAAVRFFQPEMNGGPLLEILQYFTRVADEVTGIPNYIYGSGQVAGAGRTASGLSMLMENASKGIKQAIMGLDRGVGDMLKRLYYHLMVYDPDPAIKGDMNVVASGIVGAMVRDHVQEKRNAFLQATTNPIDMSIVGVKGRAKLLREMAKGLQMSDVIPSDEEIAQNQQGQIPPEIQEQIMELQGTVQQLQAELADKTVDVELRREEFANRIEEANIRAEALVESRQHENEIRAQTETEARMREARLRAQVDREKIAASKQIAAGKDEGRGAIEAAIKPLQRQLEAMSKELAVVKAESNTAVDVVKAVTPEATVNVNVGKAPEKKAKKKP